MKKELPNLYKGKVNKDISKNVYYSKENIYDRKEVSTTIENLFSSYSYVFNINVLIKTKDNEYKTKIAGKMGDNIITVDNKVIPVSDIQDIKIIK